MTDFQFTLFDKLESIKKADALYDFSKNGYLSFSGGKDSTVVSALLDIALPSNTIPRVYCDTGIEYRLVRQFVFDLGSQDPRIQIIKPNKSIKKVLEENGYPFKSKEHSLRVNEFNKGSHGFFIQKYLTGVDKDGKPTTFKCPSCLLYQFEERGKYPYSNRCCYELKKKPFADYECSNAKNIRIDGLRNAEGGNRARLGCFSSNGNTTAYHPLIDVDDAFIDWFIDAFAVQLAPLYYPPFNFKRTGCKGCPYATDLQRELSLLSVYFPEEREQCEFLFKPVYDEYRRIGYRLDKTEQCLLF